jgi:acetylxylan esterase
MFWVVILALHPCGGTAQMYYSSTKYANLAETYGYFVVYGNAPRSQQCWDVNTNETRAVHNGGGDALGLANVARYAIQNWGVPASKVFVTGSSSGAMMTNVMAAAYPDLFIAAAVDSGVPYGCWAGPNTQSDCPAGRDIRTAQAWVNNLCPQIDPVFLI